MLRLTFIPMTFKRSKCILRLFLVICNGMNYRLMIPKESYKLLVGCLSIELNTVGLERKLASIAQRDFGSGEANKVSYIYLSAHKICSSM